MYNSSVHLIHCNGAARLAFVLAVLVKSGVSILFYQSFGAKSTGYMCATYTLNCTSNASGYSRELVMFKRCP